MVATDFITQTAAQIGIANLPPRAWVMDRRYIAGDVSVIMGPTGSGKSMLTMLDAIAMVTGKPLSGFRVTAPGPVWICSTNDHKNDVYRRVVAAAREYSVAREALKDLYLISRFNNPICLVKSHPEIGLIINQQAIDWFIKTIRKNAIKLLVVDAFNRTHYVSESVHWQIDRAASVFVEIAEQTQCSICLVCQPMSESGDDAMFVCSRIFHTLDATTECEPKAMRSPHPESAWYTKLTVAKGLGPGESEVRYKYVNVNLPNGDAEGTLKVVGTNLSNRKRRSTQNESSATQRGVK